MWPLNKRGETVEALSVATGEGEAQNADSRAFTKKPIGADEPKEVDPLQRAREDWLAQLAQLGGETPLLHFDDAPDARIELSTTHPSGLPQFITGKPTLLSYLIREDIALRRAKRAAGAITAKGAELRATRSIEGVHLAIGLARWKRESEQYVAPVLLRPLAIRRYGNDFELKLLGRPFLNPALARALRRQFGIGLDAKELVNLAVANGTFKPQPTIDRLRALTTHLPWFSVEPRLVASVFTEVAAPMVADLQNFDHPVIEALAGNPDARSILEAAFEPVKFLGQDARTPAADTLLLDADEEQENVVAQIGAGNSLLVKALPGTGGTQTVANALGLLVSRNKRVLVVSPRRSALDDISHRLQEAGMPALAMRPHTLRRDLIEAIGRNEKAVRPETGEIDEALVRLRRILVDYRTGLNEKDPDLKVSVLEMLEELARLAKLPHPPATTARLGFLALQKLAPAGIRAAAAAALVKAAKLGEFRYGPNDSPWYGAQFPDPAAATATHQLAKRMHELELPKLRRLADAMVAQTSLRQYETVAELGIYVRLLRGLRDTLDRFVPTVFDRPLSELIVAFSSSKESRAMTRANRRRLQKLAYEYVRPGVHVSDMFASLQQIQEQRVLWQRYAAAGTVPRVPVGIPEVQVAHQRVAEDLAALDAPLGRSGTDRVLARMPLANLVPLLEGLAAESEVLANLQERTALLAKLREQELDELLTDLSTRHVPASDVANELELSWWQSALEHTLVTNQALLGANMPVLDRLESDFRLVDGAHCKASAELLAHQLKERWAVGIVDEPEEAQALKKLLKAGELSPGKLFAEAPTLVKQLAPVWLVSPYEVARLPRDIFDTVFLVDAGAMSVAEAVGAIGRARQVVAFGDPVTQTPSPFTIAVAERTPEHAQLDVDALHASSIWAHLAPLLPSFALTRSYRAGGEDLVELVNERFYGGRILALPWAGTFLGHASLTMSYVESGQGLPDSVTGAVESPDDEVTRALELVRIHANRRSRESLMVVTVSQKHATNVKQAVLAAAARDKELSQFVLADRAEPFEVVTLEQSVALSRDRVIFSIGYGRTPHGRVLSNFGRLSHPGGDRLLAVAMSRARRSMDIVSSVHPDDMSDARMSSGVLALAELLRSADTIVAGHTDDEIADPLLRDLALRLSAEGLKAYLSYRGALPLVVAYEDRAAAIDTDEVVAATSLRGALRLRPERLRRLGWHYMRVHSFDLFADPDAVVQRIKKLLQVPQNTGK